ncbi:MAG: WG repeat-containing protein [Myxococcales bacterium]|nr:WG repeat-containing protein [Myxococcales bacterium]
MADAAPPVPAAVDADAAGDEDQALTRGPDACEPAMFDAAPGHHDRFRFERDDGLAGYQDGAGKVVIEPRFMVAYEFSPQGIAGATDEQGHAFIDTHGEVIARAFAFDNGPDYFVAGRARIVDGDRVGFIDEAGRVVVAPTYDGAGSFCQGLAPVCTGCRRELSGEHYELVGGKWGLIDRSGAVVVPLKYDAVRSQDDGIVVVEGGRTIPLDALGVPRSGAPR